MWYFIIQLIIVFSSFFFLLSFFVCLSNESFEFLKTMDRGIGPSMFEAEAIGLGAMYETGTIRVPKPFKVRF